MNLAPRTDYCGRINTDRLGQTVTLYGWVYRRRDHGGVIFVDLRDREGHVQIVFEPQATESFKIAESLRAESCLAVVGRVRQRPEGTTNPDLVNGEIEVVCEQVTVLNSTVTVPFQMDDENLTEAVRLRHRVLDLRRPEMQRNLRLKHRLASAARRFLDEHGFIELETPMLTRATPEGARDYLVPSRLYPGHFFALPQSPQLFKQMLMVSGFDRYYQITRCFRDEDSRGDRQPEFTQIDCELSFMSAAAIRELAEQLIVTTVRDSTQIELPQPFPILSHTQAMARFGSDKPDLRVQLEFTELTDIMRQVEFKIFHTAANSVGGRVAALRIPQGAQLTRSEIDDYTAFVATHGAKGLAWIKVNDPQQGRDGLQSPIVKNLDDGILQIILERTGALAGDLIFFGAAPAKIVNASLGALRAKLGQHPAATERGWFKAGWQPLWVVDFPLFEHDDDTKQWTACHHPFTAPRPEDLPYLETDPGRCIAQAYDMVLNGWEIGGGSIRNHQAEIQKRVFRALQFTDSRAEEQFGFLLEALRYGAPPHGGIAWGLDRIAALFAGTDSIRNVIPFPKTQKAQCLLTAAPSLVERERLDEVHLRVQQRPTT